MKFNAKKCNIMRVSRSRKPLQHFYSLGNEILQEVSDAKYLGIQIDKKLDWNKHISTVAARGQSKLAFLNLFSTNIPYMEHHFHELTLAQWCIIFGIINALLR